MIAPSLSLIAPTKTLHHPLRNPGDYNTQSFLTEVEAILADPKAVLSVPTNDMFVLLPPKTYENYLKETLPGRPTLGENLTAIGTAFTASPLAAFGSVISNSAKRASHQRSVVKTNNNAFRFIISRAAISFTEKERVVFKGAAQLTINGGYTPTQWNRFLTLMIWNGGKASLEPLPDFAGHKTMEAVRHHFAQFLKQVLPDHDTFLAEAAADISNNAAIASLTRPQSPSPQSSPNQTPPARPLAAVSQSTLPANPTSTGARWMTWDDVEKSRYYNTSPTPAALTIGYHADNGAPVYFAGHESLITVGAPGTGKSQALVIPNLLSYPGSAVVLDIKGELWDATAGYRAAKYGPVYRFSPTREDRRTHRYNPFDFISTDPVKAANDCALFAHQLIPPNPELKDQYWEGRGRDYLWTFAMLVAIELRGPARSMRSLAELISMQLDARPDSELNQILGVIRKISKLYDIPDLNNSANAIESALTSEAEKTLDSVLDTVRRYVAPFTRSPPFMQALATSDWTPQTLRRRTGSTLYICLTSEELETYSPIIRLILGQHARILQNHAARPDEPPITFFLDEMPQLGNFQTIMKMQDVGRGAGLRLWMFAQTLGQLNKAFGRDRYLGVVEACRVRTFLQPDDEAAKLLAPALGEVRNLFSGEKKPLATADELMGLAYQEKTIVTTRGDLPMTLDKKYAFDNPTKLPPPPKVPLLPVP